MIFYARCIAAAQLQVGARRGRGSLVAQASSDPKKILMMGNTECVIMYFFGRVAVY